VRHFRETIRAEFWRLFFVCAAFLIMTVAGYYYAAGVVKEQIDLYGRSAMQGYQYTMRSWILAHEAALRHVASSVSMAIARGDDADELQRILKVWSDVFQHQSDIKDIFKSLYGVLEGNYIDGTNWIPREFYNPKTAPWARRALLDPDNISFVTSIDPRSGEAVGVFSMAVSDEHGDHGVLAIDFLLNPIIEEVKAYRVAAGGFGMLLDDSFNALTYPDAQYHDDNIEEIPGFAGVAARLKTLADSGGDGILCLEHITIGGSRHIAFFSRLQNGWYLGLVAPTRHYYAKVFEMAPVMAALGSILAAILCAILLKISRARDYYEEESRMKSSFLASVSHEIRTPMNAIIGMSELAKRDYGQPQALGYIDEIRKAGQSLLAIINDILDLSRAESGKLPIAADKYKTVTLFSDVLSVIYAYLGEKKLELRFDIFPGIPSVLVGDQARLRQILLNLLSNAIKYTPEGFIEFTAKGERRSSEEIMLTFTVRDSGVGIRASDVARLFGDFVRVDEKANNNVIGAGLGLSIARNLSRAMGGDIVVASEYGQGSTFTATLVQKVADPTPIGPSDSWHEQRSERRGEEKEKIAIAAKTDNTPFIAPGCRALVVDDVAFNLAVAKGLLATWQLDIHTCQSGQEALDLLAEGEYDMIFMDHMMPEMDGIEATRRLRTMNEKLRKIPVIALTANAMTGMRELFLKSGFDDFLSKPIEIERLQEIMAKWVPEAKKRPLTEVSDDEFGQDESVIAIAGLNAKKGIATIGGSEAAYIDALGIYCRDVETHLPMLSALPSTDTMSAFITQVHGLKSASANVGAKAIAETAAILEDAGRRDDMEVIRARLEGFRVEITAMTEKIRAFLRERSHVGGDAASLESAALQESLAGLAEALTARNIGEIDRLLEAIMAESLDEQSREIMQRLSTQVLLAEFDEALALLDDVRK
jgi:signal transduction histidine kinase/HPt (histidine-containing phosphotransfer) domain-containing protein/ActR/RegA family two-component response regulator